MVLAQALHDSAVNRIRFRGMDYAPPPPSPCFWPRTKKPGPGTSVRVGRGAIERFLLSEDPQQWKLWAGFGVLAWRWRPRSCYPGGEIRRPGADYPDGQRQSSHGSGDNQRREGETFRAMMEVALGALARDVVPTKAAKDTLHPSPIVTGDA
jgi:hypothetical protein